MEITAFRPTQPPTAELAAAQARLARLRQLADGRAMPAARQISLLRVALAVSGLLTLPEAAGPLAVVLFLYVAHSMLAHWIGTARGAPERSRAWHWIDLGWGLVVVAVDGADSCAYLFFLYPIVVASLRLGTDEGAAVALGAIAGWLAIALAQGGALQWQPVFLRIASLALLAYALASSAGAAAAQRRRLRMAAATAADSERRKISLDLHDSAIQPYLGLKLGLEALRRKVEPGNALAGDIDELYRMTQESIAELRGYVGVLRGRRQPPATGLGEALRRQVERFQRFYGLKVRLELPCDPALAEGLTADVEQMLAESLSNVGRHTAARQVTVTLARTAGELAMVIADDGGNASGWRHFTPVSLTLRARRLGGRVQVAPRAGGGTEVRIFIPVEREVAMQQASHDGPIGVFLVDDHRCVLWGLEKLVAGEQPRMRVAGKATRRDDACAGIAATKPDVVLLDLDLGGSSSLDFLPELTAQSGAQFLVLTGTREAALHERAVALGARGVVRKDEAADVLIGAIESVHRGDLWLDRATMARVLGAMTRPQRADAKTRFIEPLTPKEKQIVAAIVAQRGAKGDVVAAGLHMSGHTLRNHLTTIYRKLDVRNRLELVMFALENQLAAPAAEASGRPR